MYDSFQKRWATFRSNVAQISTYLLTSVCVCVEWMITQKDCRPSVSGEISEMRTQFFSNPTLGGKGWKISQAAHIDYPLENVC